jgi:predicted GNAT family acetyltransferase
MADADIRNEETGAGGRYFLATAHGEAEMTYSLAGKERMIIDRTFVPPEDRGRDIALRLVERAVADARSRGLKIVPLCSYVASQFKRRKDWADIRAS